MKITKTIKQGQKRFTNTYTCLDKFLGNISSMDNNSSDLDGKMKESDSNIDMLVD